MGEVKHCESDIVRHLILFTHWPSLSSAHSGLVLPPVCLLAAHTASSLTTYWYCTACSDCVSGETLQSAAYCTVHMYAVHQRRSGTSEGKQPTD